MRFLAFWAARHGGLYSAFYVAPHTQYFNGVTQGGGTHLVIYTYIIMHIVTHKIVYRTSKADTRTGEIGSLMKPGVPFEVVTPKFAEDLDKSKYTPPEQLGWLAGDTK